jgi:CheY-like chemotaxis protein
MSEQATETEPGGYAIPPRKCLFGVTILLVEDSRSASEVLRLYAAECGARHRRADSLQAASRHLAIYRPQVVIVDLGLPDGDGLALIEHLANASIPFGAIVATSGMDPVEWEARTRAAGAHACLSKPISSLRDFQACMLSVLPDRGKRQAADTEIDVHGHAAVRSAHEEDLRRALALLIEATTAGDDDTILYCARFLAGSTIGADDVSYRRVAEEINGLEGDAGRTREASSELIDRLQRRLAATPGGLRGAA